METASNPWRRDGKHETAANLTMGRGRRLAFASKGPGHVENHLLYRGEAVVVDWNTPGRLKILRYELGVVAEGVAVFGWILEGSPS